MATTSPGQLFPVPSQSDSPDVPRDMMNLAKAVEKRVMAVYATTAERDTMAGAAGLQEGMFAYIKGTDKMYYYDGTAWVQWTAPRIGSGSTVPADSDTSWVNGDIYFKTS